MRGKVSFGVVEDILDRITPAYAGKSLSLFETVQRVTDHPRLCGEKVTVVVPLIPYSGSPPPMRGKVSNNPTPELPLGITPAYAGKSAGKK